MSKISELSDGGSLLPTDFLIAVRSGGNVKVQADDITVDQIRLGDNEKIELGNNQDLQLYHDGSHSYIKDAGTGQLRLLAGTNVQIWNSDATSLAANFNGDTQTSLYYAGAAKLATSASGISVTGSVTADGLTVDGDASVAGTTGATVDAGTITTGKDSVNTRTHWRMNNPNGEVAKWDSNGTDLLHFITDEYKVYTAGNKAFEIQYGCHH